MTSLKAYPLIGIFILVSKHIPYTILFFLQEQLDGSGIELSAIYKWIESQASNECFTEAWKKRIQWIGSQATPEMTDAVSKADKYLQSCYPVRRQDFIPATNIYCICIFNFDVGLGPYSCLFLSGSMGNY